MRNIYLTFACLAAVGCSDSTPEPVAPLSTNSAPQFATASLELSQDENSNAITGQVSATDADGQNLSYSLGGPDGTLFSLSANGELSPAAELDFENPADSNQDNIYELEVSASDGTDASTQTVLVSIGDVNEAPVFSSADNVSVAENVQSSLLSVGINDPERAMLSLEISGGADSEHFVLNENNTLAPVTAFDFEDPQDADGDNVYELTLSASDGSSTTEQSVVVTVEDVETAFANVSLTSSGQPGELATRWEISDEDEDIEYLALMVQSVADGPFEEAARANESDTEFLQSFDLFKLELEGLAFRLEARDISDSVLFDSGDIPLAEQLTAADLVGYFKNSNADSGDNIGQAVAVSENGKTLAVSAPREGGSAEGGSDDNSAAQAGAVYIFQKQSAGWTQSARLKASNASAGDQFGWSLSMNNSGSVLVVGALHEDSNALGVDGDETDDSVENSGAAFVFENSEAGWTQTAYLKPSVMAEQQAAFGQTVAINPRGDTIVVGAPGENSREGAVYTFQRGPDSWTAIGRVVSPEPFPGSSFGLSIALTDAGSTFFVGAPRALSGSESTGKVFIFDRSNATGGPAWLNGGELVAPDASNADSFGERLAISLNASVIAVAAPEQDSAPEGSEGVATEDTNFGAVYLFQKIGQGLPRNYRVVATLKPPYAESGDRWGTSLAMSQTGSVVALGSLLESSVASAVFTAPESDGDTQNGDRNSGAVALFSSSNAAGWTYRFSLKAPDSQANMLFGSSIGLTGFGESVVIGAKGNSGDGRRVGTGTIQDDSAGAARNSGTAYVYGVQLPRVVLQP